jgi:ABC-type multidrug transport system fused ATPase/permease subunit
VPDIYIEEALKRLTYVMVSHRLEMVMGFDKVVILEEGSVVEDGVPSELVEQEGSWFHDLWLASKSE